MLTRPEQFGSAMFSWSMQPVIVKKIIYIKLQLLINCR